MTYDKLKMINDAIWSGNLSEQDLDKMYEIAKKAYVNNNYAQVTPTTYLPTMQLIKVPDPATDNTRYMYPFNKQTYTGTPLPKDPWAKETPINNFNNSYTPKSYIQRYDVINHEVVNI